MSAMPPTADWIHLRDIDVRCILGVYPAERKKTRKVLLNISLQCNLRPAGASDQLDDTLNYEHIEAEAIAIAKKGKFFLVETLAERIATACLRHAAVKESQRPVCDMPPSTPFASLWINLPLSRIPAASPSKLRGAGSR